VATLNVKKFPDGLYARLKARAARAARERRSVAAEVIHLLDQATLAAEPLSILDLRGLGAASWEGIDAADLVASERDAWG